MTHKLHAQIIHRHTHTHITKHARNMHNIRYDRVGYRKLVCIDLRNAACLNVPQTSRPESTATRLRFFPERCQAEGPRARLSHWVWGLVRSRSLEAQRTLTLTVFVQAGILVPFDGGLARRPSIGLDTCQPSCSLHSGMRTMAVNRSQRVY